MALPFVKGPTSSAPPALPAIGGQQDSERSAPAGQPSEGHSPTRAAAARSPGAAPARRKVGHMAQRAHRPRVRAARAPIAAQPQCRPLVRAQRTNERSEREPRGEGASRGRHRQNDPRPLLAPRSAADNRGGASDGPAPAAGKRRSGRTPTAVGCWRGAERATRETRPEAADCGHALAHWSLGAVECACAPEAPRRAGVEL